MSSETKKVIALIDRKWNKLSTTDNQQFYRYFRRLWEYVRSNPLSNEILERLLFNRDTPLLKQLDGKLASKEDAEALIKGNWTYFDNNVGGEERDIALFTRLMDKVAGPKWVENMNDSKNKTWVDVMYDLAIFYVEPDNKDKYHSISLFFSLFLVPVLEYIKDNLDESVLVLDALNKFKQKSEWFEREVMLSVYTTDTKRGEKKLKKFLYEYLFHQGITFYIEPTSPTGEIDFLLQQSGERKIGCEAKVYNGRNKTNLIHGIEEQLPSYLQDHALTTGYMVIFNVTNSKLLINLDIEQGLNYLDIGSKRIYIVVVDISEVIPASKQNKKTDKPKTQTISKHDFSNQ